MKRLFYAAGLFAALSATQAFAQTSVAAANVPFAFQAGEALMPAGDYIVKESNDLMILQATKGQPAAMFMTRPASHLAKSANPSLEFQRYGSDYFLAKVWSANSQEGRALPRSKREKELARHMRFGSTKEISLQTRLRADQASR